MHIARVLVLATAALVLGMAACSLPVRDVPVRPKLGIVNETRLDVSVFVNAQKLGVFPAGRADTAINVADLREPPWDVVARSPSGRVLVTMHVEPGQVWAERNANGTGAAQGAMGRIDLSCGTLWIYAYANEPPSGGPAPNHDAGFPGDCDP